MGERGHAFGERPVGKREHLQNQRRGEREAWEVRVCATVCARVCVCVYRGIERLHSTLLCKLTGLDVQLTGLF